MTTQCKCGSYAINPRSHGRTMGLDLDLCDTCYWRKRAIATLDHAANAYAERMKAARARDKVQERRSLERRGKVL